MLALEFISPFFGWWHGFSLSIGLILSIGYGVILQYYSSKMVNSIHLSSDGKHAHVEFLNAFWMPKQKTLTIRELGYFAPSRIYNVDLAKYQQRETLYINLSRNVYKHPEYESMLRSMMSGKEFQFRSYPGKKSRGT